MMADGHVAGGRPRLSVDTAFAASYSLPPGEEEEEEEEEEDVLTFADGRTEGCSEDGRSRSTGSEGKHTSPSPSCDTVIETPTMAFPSDFHQQKSDGPASRKTVIGSFDLIPPSHQLDLPPIPQTLLLSSTAPPNHPPHRVRSPNSPTRAPTLRNRKSFSNFLFSRSGSSSSDVQRGAVGPGSSSSTGRTGRAEGQSSSSSGKNGGMPTGDTSQARPITRAMTAPLPPTSREHSGAQVGRREGDHGDERAAGWDGPNGVSRSGSSGRGILSGSEREGVSMTSPMDAYRALSPLEPTVRAPTANRDDSSSVRADSEPTTHRTVSRSSPPPAKPLSHAGPRHAPSTPLPIATKLSSRPEPRSDPLLTSKHSKPKARQGLAKFFKKAFGGIDLVPAPAPAVSSPTAVSHASSPARKVQTRVPVSSTPPTPPTETITRVELPQPIVEGDVDVEKVAEAEHVERVGHRVVPTLVGASSRLGEPIAGVEATSVDPIDSPPRSSAGDVMDVTSSCMISKRPEDIPLPPSPELTPRLAEAELRETTPPAGVTGRGRRMFDLDESEEEFTSSSDEADDPDRVNLRRLPSSQPLPIRAFASSPMALPRSLPASEAGASGASAVSAPVEYTWGGRSPPQHISNAARYAREATADSPTTSTVRSPYTAERKWSGGGSDPRVSRSRAPPPVMNNASARASSAGSLQRKGSKFRKSVYGLADTLAGRPTPEPIPLRRRVSVNPTFHTIGSISRETSQIMDADEKQRAEDMFLM